jgi:hypothetical protein
VQQFVMAVEYLYHQCIAVGSSYKSIAGAQMEDVEHNPRADDKKDITTTPPTATAAEDSAQPEESGVYEEDEEEEEDEADDEEEEGEEEEGGQRGSTTTGKDAERVFPSFSRLPMGAWATTPLLQTHGIAAGQDGGKFLACAFVEVVARLAKLRVPINSTRNRQRAIYDSAAVGRDLHGPAA